ncbi:Pr6Pr family membrane protein [Amycolatopsis sp. H20-H5]|uniref:Pr6Pr family membrane protein n=1 Tax=Amycolatopsis sp. H20-H5 TaxID=3046309 RepID=UPI002DB8DF83|nr:Pr6Pr family membrane protein [Amycolatopsis sp. H20-H5]MEC3979875.1 Pr6Pr family membrane protein [Amycolatopsis sp. H20-H5]
MVNPKIARGWFAVTALVVLTGLVVQVVSTADTTEGLFDAVAGRLANLLCFFTIDSNLLVGGTCLLLALGLTRPSTLFRVLRLDALVGIAVTGIVYQVALAGLYHLSGAAAFADTMLHKVSPILCVLGWLLFGPRGALTWRVVGLSTAFPLIWLAFTLVRGAIDDYYPYPFLDAQALGYGRVVLNCLLVAVLFTALASGALLLDRVLANRTVRPEPA